MTDELLDFVRTSFRTVWSLETLLVLHRSGERWWTPADLVAELRSSEQVVADSAQSLLVAGLVEIDSDGRIRYRAASPELHEMVIQVDDAYRRKASALRRAIVQTGNDKLRTFANAFILRKPSS